MMLQHIGQIDVAEKISNAWLKTLEDGIHTADIYNQEFSNKKVTCSEFAEELIKRLGSTPGRLKPVSFSENQEQTIEVRDEDLKPKGKKQLVGTDIFIDKAQISPDEIGKSLQEASNGSLQLKMITNRGVKVFPNGNPETFCTDHWRCRFVNSKIDLSEKGVTYLPVEAHDLLRLQTSLLDAGFDIIKTENLYEFENYRGFSLGQGE